MKRFLFLLPAVLLLALAFAPTARAACRGGSCAGVPLPAIQYSGYHGVSGDGDCEAYYGALSRESMRRALFGGQCGVGYNPIQPNPPLVQNARYGCASGACGGASATCGGRGAACHSGRHFRLFGRRRCH